MGRGEWGLVSYMAVCSMTVGGSNTTSTNRVIGTFIGAALSIVAWVLASDHGYTNPWLLGFFGWLVSLGCFYLIVAKNNGPMGRFILLTYNLGALYSYSLSIKDDDHDDDEGGHRPRHLGYRDASPGRRRRRLRMGDRRHPFHLAHLCAS